MKAKNALDEATAGAIDIAIRPWGPLIVDCPPTVVAAGVTMGVLVSHTISVDPGFALTDILTALLLAVRVPPLEFVYKPTIQELAATVVIANVFDVLELDVGNEEASGCPDCLAPEYATAVKARYVLPTPTEAKVFEPDAGASK